MKVSCVFNPDAAFSAFIRIGETMHSMSSSSEESVFMDEMKSWLGDLSDLEYSGATLVNTFTESEQWDVGKLTVTNSYYYLGEFAGYK